MKQHSTDRLLTLGMALTTDRRAMERRVRGVFARKKSAKGILILSVVLAVALGFGAFTTACQPGHNKSTLTPIPVEQAENRGPEASAVNTASGAHLTQPDETLPGGVTLSVDADVIIPQTEGYSIRECTLDSFTLDDYQKMLGYFAPDTEWMMRADAADFQTNGTLDLANTDLDGLTTVSIERDGDMVFARFGDRSRKFLFVGSGGILYSEGFILGDEEMEQEFGDVIREPIDLTQAAAQAQADQVIFDLNLQGLQLYSVQRACKFDENNTNNVLSRGWLFAYGITNGGLSVHNESNYAYNTNDRLSYWSVYSGGVAVYVDESGIALFDCEKRYQPSEVTYPVETIIGANEALDLARERISRLYGTLEVDSGEMRIEIYSVRLGSTLIGFSDTLTGQPFPEVYEDIALLIPTWDILFREVYESGDTQYFSMPFCAIDGGAVSMTEP